MALEWREIVTFNLSALRTHHLPSARVPLPSVCITDRGCVFGKGTVCLLNRQLTVTLAAEFPSDPVKECQDIDLGQVESHLQDRTGLPT